MANVVLVGSMVMAIGIPADAEAGCPPGPVMCALGALALGWDCPTWTGGYCVGEDCAMGAQGEGILLLSSSTDEEDALEGQDGYTTRWLARHEGTMFDLEPKPDHQAPIPCEALIEHPHGNFVIMPEEGPDAGHCVVGLDTGGHTYLEFIASKPDIQCHGWTECQCD